jgi:hypothetical protein
MCKTRYSTCQTMLDSNWRSRHGDGGLALGVPVKPHAFGVPLTRFQGWAGPPARQFTTYAETALKLVLQLVGSNMNRRCPKDQMPVFSSKDTPAGHHIPFALLIVRAANTARKQASHWRAGTPEPSMIAAKVCGLGGAGGLALLGTRNTSLPSLSDHTSLAPGGKASLSPWRRSFRLMTTS